MTKRFGFWFASTGYLLTVLYYFGPWGIAYNTTLYRILPFWMCVLTGHGHPVSGAVQQPRLLYGNLLQTRQLATFRSLRSARNNSWFP
jgi:hypothetical protein